MDLTTELDCTNFYGVSWTNRLALWLMGPTPQMKPKGVQEGLDQSARTDNRKQRQF
jgi:hypothetical protein